LKSYKSTGIIIDYIIINNSDSKSAVL